MWLCVCVCDCLLRFSYKHLVVMDMKKFFRVHKWIGQKIGKTAGRHKHSVSCSHMDGQLQGPLLAENVTLAKCLC